MRLPRRPSRPGAFTLIELLTVVAIISLLISMLMPSLGRARDQAKGVHCNARLADFAIALGTYENINRDLLPPAEWCPAGCGEEPTYGWMEIIYKHIWKEEVFDEKAEERGSFPVQRNVHPDDWQEYFACRASPLNRVHSGHYRVYLPAWLMGTYTLDEEGRYNVEEIVLNPKLAGSRSMIAPRMPLIGDANEQSERGDGLGTDDCSYIDAGEANTAGSRGFNGNRFSDRHYGGTNYLFQDFHAEWIPNPFRDRLARDFDLNGVDDVEVDPQ